MLEVGTIDTLITQQEEQRQTIHFRNSKSSRVLSIPSATGRPGGHLLPIAVAVMASRFSDLSSQFPNPNLSSPPLTFVTPTTRGQCVLGAVLVYPVISLCQGKLPWWLDQHKVAGCRQTAQLRQKWLIVIYKEKKKLKSLNFLRNISTFSRILPRDEGS